MLDSDSSLRFMGSADAQILVVCDAPSDVVYQAGAVMSQGEQSLLSSYAIKHGLPFELFAFVTPCPPVPDSYLGSDSREGKFIKQYQEQFSNLCSKLHNLKLIVSFGALAAKQALNGTCKITKVRGQLVNTNHRSVPVMPMFSPKHVMRRPEAKDYFESDMRTLAELVQAGFDFEQSAKVKLAGNYRWVLDLGEVIAEMDRQIAERGVFACSLDTEFTGGKGKWYLGAKLLIGQITFNAGSSVCFPLDVDYWNSHCVAVGQPSITQDNVDHIFSQLRHITENPASFISGHALTADKHVLRNHNVEVVNHFTDTMQLCFVVDDNMLVKSLDEATRRWIPALSGYADAFNNDSIHQDKSRMDLVPLDKMLMYGGGDTDAAFRLSHLLTVEGQKDSRNWMRYRAIHMPGLHTFFEMERKGIKVDTTKLAELGVTLNARKEELYNMLIAGVPTLVIQKHKDDGLKFSRDSFVRDILFSELGFGLTPVVFTKGTAKLGEDDKVPSVSTKQHLPFFEGETPYSVTVDGRTDTRDWVSDYKEYEKVCTMIDRYVGESQHETIEVKGTKRRSFDATWCDHIPNAEERNDDGQLSWYFSNDLPKDLVKAGGVVVNGIKFESSIRYPLYARCKSEADTLAADYHNRWINVVHQARIDAGILVRKQHDATGFWQYLSKDNRVHPSFFLHRTNTGRSASASPNFQNIPKRGPLAKAYRKIFRPDDGWVFIEADLSQAELRVAAIMANERTMLSVYSKGGDIHAETAAGTMGLSLEQFQQLDPDVMDLKRFQAKAVNFGFLYGMWWVKFKAYAKTDYGIDFTDDEAKELRLAFFRKYPGLERWHESMKAFVRSHGYVRGLHGALRRLPNMSSHDEKIRQDCERQAINAPVQGFASDMGICGMNRFFRDAPLDVMHPVAFIHDAVVVHAREDYADEAASAIKFYMETFPSHWFDADGQGNKLHLPIPIVSDLKMSDVSGNLSEMRDRKDLLATAPSWHRPELDERPPF